MWLQRLLARVHAHPGPILIEGGDEYGAPFLIEAMRRIEQVAWLRLTPNEAADFVAIGNLLADAVNTALEANFLPHSLPFNYNIELLKKRLPLIQPLTIVCSNAEYAPLFRDSLLELSSSKAKVILIVNQSIPTFRTGFHLRQEELALSPAEAEEVAGIHLGSTDINTIRRSCGGAYLTFLSSVHRIRDMALPVIPSPQGDMLIYGNDSLVSPVAMFEVLINLKRYIEALEIAVMSMPERVTEVIEEAGHSYQERGLLKRLHLLLESLDDVYMQDERVLGWRLVAGFDQANYSHFMPTIKTYLENHEAPELRARYAGMLTDSTERFAQAQRAATAKTTALSLFQLGRIHSNAQEGYKILRQALKLAEAGGRPYEVTRSAGALAEHLIYMGRFREAATWSQWALQISARMGLKDGIARVANICTDADARILLGHTTGLRDTLIETKDASVSVSAEMGIATTLWISLSNLELVLGNISEAEQVATENFKNATRVHVGEVAVPLVRILLEQGKLDEALVTAEQAWTLLSEDDEWYSLPASLALGMVYSFTDPDSARSHLKKVLEARDLEAVYRIMAALHLLRIGALERSELSPEMQEILKELSPSGFRLFCGPESAFATIWGMFTEQNTPLRIRVLGQKEVWLDNQRLQLGDRVTEALVLLALHPEGLAAETLHSYLYKDEDGTLSALRVVISRLRRNISISTVRDVYQITVPFAFDVQDCENAIDSGDVKTAMELYRGPLLERSEAPGIIEARGFLEERLRQRALDSNDADTLLPLAETLKDDIELWQATQTALPNNDARLPLVRAQLRRVTQNLRPTYN